MRAQRERIPKRNQVLLARSFRITITCDVRHIDSDGGLKGYIRTRSDCGSCLFTEYRVYQGVSPCDKLEVVRKLAYKCDSLLEILRAVFETNDIREPVVETLDKANRKCISGACRQIVEKIGRSITSAIAP